MFCSSCGKQIDEDSTFCHFCGKKVANSASNPQSKNPSKDERAEEKPVNKTKVDLLWDKFAEIYDAKGDEKNKFNKLSSEHVWELMERLYTNTFETFIQEKKNELNTHPYKTIEELKKMYLYSTIGGYWLWTAEALANEKPLGEFKTFSIGEFVDEWKVYDFQKAAKSISDELSTCISMYLEHRMGDFIESAPSIKDVSNATMEMLRSSITFQILNGYNVGEVESKFRK